MKTTLIALFVTTLTLLNFSGCASEKEPTSVEPQEDKFRTINAANNRVGEQTVSCINCTAKFKLSHAIHKMSMKGDAVVDCPVCHKDYLKKSK